MDEADIVLVEYKPQTTGMPSLPAQSLPNVSPRLSTTHHLKPENISQSSGHIMSEVQESTYCNCGSSIKHFDQCIPGPRGVQCQEEAALVPAQGEHPSIPEVHFLYDRRRLERIDCSFLSTLPHRSKHENRLAGDGPYHQPPPVRHISFLIPEDTY